MAGDGFKEYVIKFLLGSLFIVCLFAFAVNFTTDQGKDAGVIDDGNLNFDELEESVNETSEDAEAWGEAFRSDNLFVSLGAIVLFSIWGVSKLIWTSVINLFSLIFDSLSTVLGVPSIVIGVVTAILIVSMIFSIWRLVKRGD